MNLKELYSWKKAVDSGEIKAPEKTHYINNHIHTNYSFSPYTPSDAARMAYANGLATAGIMDHDTVCGAREFLEAGKILGLPVTVGVECRVDMSETSLKGKRINNPDQISVAYLVMHGIPHKNLEKVDAYFEPYRQARNRRNREMTAKICALTKPYGITLDYEKDIKPLARVTMTERHVLFGLVKKITEKYPEPSDAVAFLSDTLGVKIPEKPKAFLLDGKTTPQFYEYDMLGVLKSSLIEQIYIPATDELPSLGEYREMVKTYGGIAAYAYLGDVGNSVTGDKKSQKFEDDYLEELFEVLRKYEFDAVTFMPTRNTPEQLERIMAMCRRDKFFQISGEDINSPRQSFICPAYDKPEFEHLVKAAYTLIEYENMAENDLSGARELIKQ